MTNGHNKKRPFYVEINFVPIAPEEGHEFSKQLIELLVTGAMRRNPATVKATLPPQKVK